ncbi:transposase [Streptomyces sp. NPDC059349]|uniref:IS110 family transposase n=1 Tax=unclassified Streptomyces TaxID=2593676 RepID=UPI0036447488
MSMSHERIWVGIDAGKGHHWAVAVDADGETLFSTKVINDEAQIRLKELGATPADVGQGDAPWTVMADPEGAGYCTAG